MSSVLYKKSFFPTKDVLTSLERKLFLRFTKQQCYLKSLWSQKRKKLKRNQKRKLNSTYNQSDSTSQVVKISTRCAIKSFRKQCIESDDFLLHCKPFDIQQMSILNSLRVAFHNWNVQQVCRSLCNHTTFEMITSESGSFRFGSLRFHCTIAVQFSWKYLRH